MNQPDHRDEDMQEAWDQAGAAYQERRQIPTDDVYYGPWGPAEQDLGLLGDVQGKQILELGGGGGQAAIALATRGARVTGLDLSREQIAFARKLAEQSGVTATFLEGDAADLHPFPDAAYHLVLSIYALKYVGPVERCLAECRRVLQPGGKLIFSLDHPLRVCFWDEEELAETIYPVRSYFDSRPLCWPFAESGVWMRSYHRTTAQWVDLLAAAGFRLQRLLEPPPPEDLAEDASADEYTLQVATRLPQTIIFVAAKE